MRSMRRMAVTCAALALAAAPVAAMTGCGSGSADRAPATISAPAQVRHATPGGSTAAKSDDGVLRSARGDRDGEVRASSASSEADRSSAADSGPDLSGIPDASNAQMEKLANQWLSFVADGDGTVSDYAMTGATQATRIGYVEGVAQSYDAATDTLYAPDEATRDRWLRQQTYDRFQASDDGTLAARVAAIKWLQKPDSVSQQMRDAGAGELADILDETLSPLGTSGATAALADWLAALDPQGVSSAGIDASSASDAKSSSSGATLADFARGIGDARPGFRAGSGLRLSESEATTYMKYLNAELSRVLAIDPTAQPAAPTVAAPAPEQPEESVTPAPEEPAAEESAEAAAPASDVPDEAAPGVSYGAVSYQGGAQQPAAQQASAPSSGEAAPSVSYGPVQGGASNVQQGEPQVTWVQGPTTTTTTRYATVQGPTSTSSSTSYGISLTTS